MAVCMFVKFNKEDYIDDQIPHLLFPMFFNLMFKTTHFVFRQNRSVKVSKSQKQPMVSSILPKNEQRISALASKERSNQKNKGTLLY